MKKFILLLVLCVSTQAFSAPFVESKNITAAWLNIKADFPEDAISKTLTTNITPVGQVNIKVAVINQRVGFNPKLVNRLVLITDDGTNEYAFILAENRNITEIKSLRMGKSSPSVLEIDAISNGKVVELNLLMTITQHNNIAKLYHGIVLFGTSGYSRR